MQRRTFLGVGLAGLGTLAMAKTGAAQFIPNPSKEKWAILYGTWYGTARDASTWISEGMGGIATIVDIRKLPDNFLANDHIIVGTSIQSNRGPKALDAYLTKNAAALKGKIRGLFVVCGNMGKMPGPDQEKAYVDNYLAKVCNVDPKNLPKRILGGRITRSLMPAAEHKMVVELYAKLGGPSGDFDNLSRVECLKLGSEIIAART
ncbi:MAG TPA: flavodoxin domain-containing protein [Acidobacteriota bacterium]|nr:flavodoxin domain-containing protein [Acidobacteriota bacterium]